MAPELGGAAAASPSVASAPMKLSWAGLSDVGLHRDHNEDNFVVAHLGDPTVRGTLPKAEGSFGLGPHGALFAVCDGMGGAAAGEVASQLAVERLQAEMAQSEPAPNRDAFAWRLVRALERSGAAIFEMASGDRRRRGMGTTATVAGLMDNVLFVGQVGDSRAYLLRNGRLELVSKDQSLVNQLLEAGQLTEAEAQAFEHSNIILQALGTAEDLAVDLTFLELRDGDLLLLCSDGLSGMMAHQLMQETLAMELPLAERVAQLIAQANEGGGHDNITAIAVHFEGGGLSSPDDQVRAHYQQYPLMPSTEERSEDAIPTRVGRVRTRSLPQVGDLEPEPTRPGLPRSHEALGAVQSSSAGGVRKPVWLRWTPAALVLLAAFAFVLWRWRDETPAPRSPEASPRLARPVTPVAAAAPVALTVSLPATATQLLVDGRVHEASLSTLELSLPPGLYRFEARQGETLLVAEVVEVPAVETLLVELNAPVEEAAAEDSPVLDAVPGVSETRASKRPGVPDAAAREAAPADATKSPKPGRSAKASEETATRELAPRAPARVSGPQTKQARTLSEARATVKPEAAAVSKDAEAKDPATKPAASKPAATTKPEAAKPSEAAPDAAPESSPGSAPVGTAPVAD